MTTQQKISLKNYNTFSVDVSTDYFFRITHYEDLQKALDFDKRPFVLGGGSNILLTRNIEGSTFYINNKGIEIIEDQKQYVLVKVSAGENWSGFVDWSVSKRLGGLENLSLIPGNVGTSPVQNIGAYGVELKDVFHSCKAIEIQTGKEFFLTNQDCQFSYRNSILKGKLKGKCIVWEVIFKLTKQLYHKPNIGYGNISSFIKDKDNPTALEVANAVKQIRQSKLPNPKEIPNAGSFFKNPYIKNALLTKIKEDYPRIPFYKIDSAYVKIPAGWLIEQCNFKGFRKGNAGVYSKQALILINYGKAKGLEIKNLAIDIQNKVQQRFGIELEFEVNIF